MRPLDWWIRKTRQEEFCYRCSMPGIFHCEFPRCRRPLCAKHRVRKAGGDLCPPHQHATLLQEEAVPQTRFRDGGIAVPHQEEE